MEVLTTTSSEMYEDVEKKVIEGGELSTDEKLIIIRALEKAKSKSVVDINWNGTTPKSTPFENVPYCQSNCAK